MPRHKKVASLYASCVQEVYKLIYTYCTNLEENQGKSLKIINLNLYLVQNYPSSVLDDLLEHHINHLPLSTESLQSYYFCKAVLHGQCKKFQAKNHRLNVSHWKCMFQTSFANLKILNLAMSCTDAILDLIPQHCPVLESLNATCKYERMEYFGNAMSFSLSVSDKGLGHLSRCKHLKMLTVNEARSQGTGKTPSITHEGLRQLLRDVVTLEDISYSDSGAVIAKHMQDVHTLNLRSIRHFNASQQSLREILRLCPHLEELYLVFFSLEESTEIVEEMLQASRLQLKSLETHNLSFGPMFTRFFEHIGPNLQSLSLINNYEPMTFENLVTIAKSCPYLTYLGGMRMCNRGESSMRPKNMNQFQWLENLYVIGMGSDIENVLIFCTQNARNLTNLKVAERALNINVDRIFLQAIEPLGLQHLDVSPMLEFSKEGVRSIINKYVNLTNLRIFCRDDISDIERDMHEQNLNFSLYNKILHTVF